MQNQATVSNIEQHDDGYEEIREAIVDRAQKLMKEKNLFTVESSDLFDLFLSKLPESVRQYNTCNACKKFFERFGGLVTINENGKTVSLLWNRDVNSRSLYSNAIRDLAREVESRNVTGVFISDEAVWGTPVTGAWTHFYAKPTSSHIKKSLVSTSHQLICEKREDFGSLTRGLAEFDVKSLKLAHAFLETNSLYRSEKVLGVTKWLLELHEKLSNAKGSKRENIIWNAVASAPPGFCHVKSTMIGTLLEDIESGMDFEDVKRRFDSKMNPLQYMRPQAPPSAGNVAQAEKIVSQLEAAGALKRRYARLEDLECLWQPRTVKNNQQSNDGVFSGVKTKNAKRNDVIVNEAPAVKITWVKFRDTVLKTAERIEYKVMQSAETYCALVTAENSEAPPVIQWDSEEKRNPVSWYVYSGGSYPAKWNLSNGFNEVTAVTLQPSMWNGGKLTHMGESVIFVIKNAKDLNHNTSGLGLFPEIMKNEFHGIRSVLEAYSRQNKITGFEESNACGIMIGNHINTYHEFRITSGGVSTLYRIDRWD